MMLVIIMGFFGFAVAYALTRYLCSPQSIILLLDHPNERSLHDAAKPRTGGLAILAGLSIGCLPVFLKGGKGDVGPEFWLVLMTLVLGAASFWDDRKGLHPLIRLILHALVAVILVHFGGMSLKVLEFPLVGSIDLGRWAFPLTVLFIMWMANLYNFMDGLDGLAGGMTVMGCFVLGVINLSRGDLTSASIALSAACATGGYLFFNFPPAKIFMGDIGSVSLGFLIGGLAVTGINRGHFDVWVPLLIFSPFIIDATLTLLKRVKKGSKVWQAHREHYYQRLVLAGLGHRKTLIAEYILMGASGLSALLYVGLKASQRLQFLVLWAIVYALLIMAVRAIEGHSKKPPL